MATKISFEGKRELRWLEIGHCLVCYMEAEVEFGDELWDDWMDAMRRSNVRSMLVCSWGATQPTHQQWRKATRLMRERELSVAVISDARHNFALAKAASWLGTNISSYRWGDLGEACDFVGINPDSQVTSKARIIALRDRFGAVTEAADLGEKVVAPVKVSFGQGFMASSDVVSATNDEIQAKLAEVQKRFRSRNDEALANSHD